jgi:hypothetical protein
VGRFERPEWDLKKQIQTLRRTCRQDWLTNVDQPDGGHEEPYAVLCEEIFKTIIALVGMMILQLWTTGGEDPPSWEHILNLTLNLNCGKDDKKKNDQGHFYKPDLSIRGLNPNALGDEVLSQRTRTRILIATVDAKNTSNARKRYQKEGLTKDEYISQLILNHEPLARTMKNLTKDCWQAHTHHLIAQVFLVLL